MAIKDENQRANILAVDGVVLGKTDEKQIPAVQAVEGIVFDEGGVLDRLQGASSHDEKVEVRSEYHHLVDGLPMPRAARAFLDGAVTRTYFGEPKVTEYPTFEEGWACPGGGVKKW